MAVIAEVTLRGVSQEQYDAVRAGARWLEEAPEGGLGHLTWWEGPDCRNVDGWESEAAFAAFAEQRLGPAMARLGLDVQPEVTFHAAHEVYTPLRRTWTDDGSKTTPDDVATLRSAYAAFAAGDIPAVMAVLDPDIDWYTPDTVRLGGRYSGRDGVGQLFAALPQNYAELRVEPERYIDSGDTVVALGTHRGLTVSGNRFEVPFVHVWTFRDGRAIGFTEHFDTERLNRALGATPATTPEPRAAGADAAAPIGTSPR